VEIRSVRDTLAKEVHDFEQVKEHHRKIAKNA